MPRSVTSKAEPWSQLEAGLFLRLEIHPALVHVPGQLSTRCRLLRQCSEDDWLEESDGREPLHPIHS